MNFLFVIIASLTTIAAAASTTSSCGDCMPIGAPYDDSYLVTRLWSIIGDNITDLDSRNFAMSVPSRDDILFGESPEEDSVWGRDFKIRLKSKRTGRQIDLNVKFSKSIIDVAPQDPPTVSESAPCGSTDLDLAIGNDGGVTITNPAEIVDPETPQPLPIDPQEPFDPDSPGMAEAREVLEMEAVGDRLLELAGVDSVDELIAGQDLADFLNDALDGVGTSTSNVSPTGAAAGVGNLSGGGGGYSGQSQDSIPVGMAGGGSDDDRSGNSGSSGGEGEEQVGDDVSEDDVQGLGMAGGPTNNLNNTNNATMPTVQGLVQVSGNNVNVSGNNYNQENADDLERPDR